MQLHSRTEAAALGAETARGVKALVVAMMQQALADLRLPSYAASARRWLESESEAPFSYRWCCAVLDIGPQWLRNEVKAGRVG